MEIRQVDGPLVEKYVGEVPELVWSTGPIAYEFQFGDFAFFEAFVRESWSTPGTLFAADATRVAVEGDVLLGIEIGFHAPDFRERGAACVGFAGRLIERGETTQAGLEQFVARVEQASWLNPVTRPDRYYVHALAVKPEHRGKRVGLALMNDAIRRGREQGFGSLELDVLSDNPAVKFYESLGLEMLAETRAPAPEAFGVPPERRMGMAI